MYNTIAYISLFIAIVLSIIGLIDILWIPSLIENNDYRLGIGVIIVGLGRVYYKSHTIPISKAINEYWINFNKK